MRRQIKQEILTEVNEDTLVMTEESAMHISGYKQQKWNLSEFLESFYVHFVRESEDKVEIEFDLVNVGAPIANAIRRVLIAEVPSMAIEKVFLYQNTSVIPDEVLCHRLGLLPIYASSTHFSFPPVKELVEDEAAAEPTEEPAGDSNQNLIFELHVKCKKKKSINEPTSLLQDNAERLYENAIVRSGQFKWIPIEKQVKIYSEDPPRIINDGIVVAKLRPGQEIEARCHCVKGIGRDHAKFSPVATASYRMLPEIRILTPIYGENAIKFQSCFTEGVIDIDPETNAAYVKDARRDMCSRNVLKYDEFKNTVYLGKNTDYFIFNVESVGAVSSKDLVVNATQVLRAKLRLLHSLLTEKLSATSLKHK